MSEHHATIAWQRQTEGFTYDEYNREHEWRFPGGESIAASAAPAFLGKGTNVDPEEAFVAALSSCHMLTFLAICARKRIVVDAYRDRAVGFLEKNDQGRLSVTRVILDPLITFAESSPDPDVIARIHHLSHQECFTANSVHTKIRVAGLD